MQEANFNKNLNLPSGSGKYTKLKSKGDKIKFRIAGTPNYETQHWLSRTEVVLCEKYNSDKKDAVCTYCDDYNAAIDNDDKEIAKQLNPVTTFYYPVFDFGTGKATIFQFTAKGIHYTLKGYADEGVDVFACNWSVERTEDPGSYYKVMRLDSKPLTEEQKKQLDIAKKLNLKGSLSSSVREEDEPESKSDSEVIIH